MLNNIAGSLALQFQRKYLEIFLIKTQQKINCRVNDRGKSNSNFIRREIIKTKNSWQLAVLGDRKWVYCHSENVSQKYKINSTIMDNLVSHFSSLDGQGQAIWTSPIPLGLAPGLCTELPKSRAYLLPFKVQLLWILFGPSYLPHLSSACLLVVGHRSGLLASQKVRSQ